MTSTVPTAVHDERETRNRETPDALPPVTMFGPDFPYAYDDYLAHPAGLGQIPATEHGGEVAVIGGGLSGLVAAYELMKMGLKPVVHEADRIGGRLRTVGFEGCDDSLTAEMGAMRFPPSSTALQHYIDLVGLRTEPFPNPLAPTTPRPSSTSRASPTTPAPSTICRRCTVRWPTPGTPAWRRARTSPT